MHKILCLSFLISLAGCSSANHRPPLTVTHIENDVTKNLTYPNLPELPAWVLDGFAQEPNDVAIHCTKPDSDSSVDLRKAKRNAEIFAKARLVKQIGASEVVYSKEELENEKYNIQVKSRSSGYLPDTEILKSQVFKYKNSLNSCVAVGFTNNF